MLTVVVNTVVIDSVSCIRFSQNMDGLKMFILCVMTRSRVVVCFLHRCEISLKPGCGVGLGE